MDDILHQAGGGSDRRRGGGRRGERQREADMPRVVRAVIRIPQEDGSSRTTAISRWTRPGNPSGGELIVMSSSPGTSSNSRESMRSSFLSHFQSRDCSSLWRENEVESSDSGDSDYDEDDDFVVAESANRSKAAKNRSRSITAGTTPRVVENRSESSKLAKIMSSSKAETAESCVVKKERDHDLSDGFERSSVESGSSGWSDCHGSGSELEEESEYHKGCMVADPYGFEAHKCSRKYKSATEFHNVCAALQRGLLNKKALDWSAITTRRQQEPPGSGAEGFPTSSSACMREVADKDCVLEKQNIVGMSKGERTVSVEVGKGRRDRAAWRKALKSFSSKYKCSPARHLLYRIIYKAPKPVDEQDWKMQNDVKLETEELEDQEKPRNGRENLDAGRTFEKLGPELAQELVENKRMEREAELRSLAMHGCGAGLEEFDEEIGLCRGLTADRCFNGSRSIKESSRRIELSCSEGCCVLFHFQACWREFEKNFRDNNTDWKMVRGAICMTPDCPGKLIKVQTRESKQVIHELVEEVKKEKKPAIHRDLPSSHSKKMVKTAKLKSKEARSTSAEIAEQSQILIVHPSSSESFERRGCIEPATLSNASTSNVPPICDLLPISTSAEIAEQAKILRVDSSSSKSFEKDKEPSAVGEGSAMLAVVPEGPLQVYKKKNEVMAVSKEPTRKLKMKKSKSKGKKVHLFRDGFTLPSAEEQEDSDPGFFGMTHDYWSDQVLSPLISEPSATQFPPLSVGESSVMTNPKSSVFSPLAVLKAQSLLVDPEHQESVRSPHLLIENVHPEADYAEMRDLFAQGGSMVQLDLFPFYHIATVSMGSWEEAVTARGLNNNTSVQGMKLKCTYFLKEQLQPDLFSNVPDEYFHANELGGGTLQPDEPAHTHGSVQPGSPLPAPTVESAITMEHASTLTCTPTESQESGALADPTPTFNSLTMSTALAPTLPHHISLESRGTNFQQVPMLEPISMSPIVTMPHGSDSSSAQLTQNVEVLKSTFINSSGTPLRVTARPFVVGEYSAHCLRSSEESSVVTSETLLVGSMSSELSDIGIAAASDAIPPVSLLIDSRGVDNSSIALSSLASSHEPGTSLLDMKSFNLATDGTDENRIPQYPTIHDYEYLTSPDFHQLSFPKTNNPDAYYSMSEPNWRPAHIECSLTGLSSSVFPPLDYGTPSLSCSVSPVQENETPSFSFGQVIGCNHETLAMYKQMSRFCVSTKHLLAVPRIAPGTCILFLYNILTQQTYGVYQSSSYGMKPMVGPMMESMVAYAPSVGFDTLHDYPVSLTGAELESVLPGATQMSGRSLYLSFSQMKQVLLIFRLKNMAQTCSIDSGPYPDISEAELLNLTSEGRVSPPASLNLTTSSLDNAAPPSPPCISFAAKFQGEELCSPKASSLRSELGLEPDSRVFDTTPPPAKATPQLSPMELFPHLFPKAIVADQQEKAHDMSFEPVQPNSSEPQLRSSSVYNPLMMDTVLQHATPVNESVSQYLLPHPKLGYNPLAFEQDREKQQLEVEMSNKERSFASQEVSVSEECFLGLSTGSAESLIRTQEAIEMQVSSTSGVPTASLLFPSYYEVATPISDVTVPGLELATSSSVFLASPKVEVHFSAILTDSVTIKQTEPNLQKHAHLCCYCYARPPDHLILDCRHLGPCLDCKNTRSVDICGQPNCGTWVTKMLRIHL
ncbi:unnamed protein product [Sphagnum jensenii]|uniref:DCD domain-containing protein n=1 Tax=Sphagnum jensenii TaxID=128206 RepID=A0ABP1B5X9_9BRYO